MAQNKVFGSDITRTHSKLKNDLYDILIIDPVAPLVINDTKNLSCDFVPKTDKYFIPKKKVRVKVKTVRNIRDVFEKDVYNTLENDLEKQQNILLRKIRGGSSKDEKTKLMAKHMLNTDKPISRMAWQMVTNINPDDHVHPSQYVLCNGKCIQVNGSKGGKIKFICKYDLGIQRTFLLQRQIKKSNLTAKKNLLKHSLNIKFKPGPLSKKKYLDMSYQKYNIGNIQLAHLPKTGLDIIPEFGKPLESSITNFLHNLRDVNGIISAKWAEFAISTLGTEVNGRAIQLNKDCCVTFNLNYKYEQSRLLMRNGIDRFDYDQIQRRILPISHTENEETIIREVKNMLDEMLISTEINILQNNMYSGEDSLREIDADVVTGFNTHSKDKTKQRGELGRLDVTVIRLSDTEEKKKVDACGKSFCSLGCVCDTLLSTYHLKKHCGRIECMFECKCDFSKYNPNFCFEDDIPELVNLDQENNLKLSKEEKKFHQTVVLSGEKSIVLKSQKRNWKAPKRYADFYSNMCLKTKKKTERILSVLDIKLNCGNIEPWCMVHNLYKCFCKGKFTERYVSSDLTKNTYIENNNDTSKLSQNENFQVDLNVENDKLTIERSLRLRMRSDIHIMDKANEKLLNNDKTPLLTNTFQGKCARTKEYSGRKYSDNHYLEINKKIQEMEKNDSGLLKRMIKLTNDEIEDRKKAKIESDSLSIIDLSTSPVPDQTDEMLSQTKDETQNELPNSVPTCSELSNNSPLNLNVKSWLLPTLKVYGQRLSKGNFKKTLDPPKAGKVALYPWDFIIKRYHDRKNFFFVTDKRPFRIFLAVDSKNIFFNTCINLNSIVDSEKYPQSVKSILANDIDNLKDQLCILRGLDFCWEFVGSLQKVRGSDNHGSKITYNESSIEIDECSIPNQTNFNVSPAKSTTDMPLSPPLEKNTDTSKWFVMTIENDFSEIQFYKKGFFVKYESIINAINVARISENTVRLSSHKCVEGIGDPQFGIYAIPNAHEYCVFIGPYEKNEPLGIETIKSTLYSGKKRTRGVWITTNKIDNSRVIDNPLSFMSYVNLEHEQVLDDSIQNESNINSLSSTADNKHKIVKLTKPIKIAKTNNFYHLTSSGLLKQIPVPIEKQNSISNTPFLLNKCLSRDLDVTIAKNPLLCKASSLLLQSNKNTTYPNNETISTSINTPHKRPIAEIAPQIKIIDECPESNSARPKRSIRKFANKEGGMFVLKPEEINIRSLENKISCTSTPTGNNYDDISLVTDNDIHMDIENFLANSVECIEPSADVYVISDDEDYCNIEIDSKIKCWNDVFIVSKNVENIGWISGRQDANKHLSFEFPGFKYTEFYVKEEAFAKINQVLSRKIYVPKHLDPNWCVVETKEDLKNKQKLKQEDLGPDYVLTKHGLMHKFEIAARLNNKNDSEGGTRLPMTSSNKIKKEETKMVISITDINKLDNQSNGLDEESEAVLRKGELSNRFSKMSNDIRQQISDRLRSIITNPNNS